MLNRCIKFNCKTAVEGQDAEVSVTDIDKC